jgi:hypothetical protein
MLSGASILHCGLVTRKQEEDRQKFAQRFRLAGGATLVVSLEGMQPHDFQWRHAAGCRV